MPLVGSPYASFSHTSIEGSWHTNVGPAGPIPGAYGSASGSHASAPQTMDHQPPNSQLTFINHSYGPPHRRSAQTMDHQPPNSQLTFINYSYGPVPTPDVKPHRPSCELRFI